jgi:hypothetical protein
MRKEISQGEILHNRNEMQFKMNTSDALFRLSERVRKLEENLKPFDNDDLKKVCDDNGCEYWNNKCMLTPSEKADCCPNRQT